jgi:hypothetical protein
VIPGAECYVGRNDNPSFSPCGSFLLHPGLLNISVSHCPAHPGTIKKTIKKFRLKLARSRSACFRKLSGMPLARRARTRYVTVLCAYWTRVASPRCTGFDNDGTLAGVCVQSRRRRARSCTGGTRLASFRSRGAFIRGPHVFISFPCPLARHRTYWALNDKTY